MLTVGRGPFAIVAADLNRDGMADLVVANSAVNTISVLTGHGDGTFDATEYGVGYNPSSLTVADLDGNGWPDIVVTSFLDGTTTLLMNGPPRSAFGVPSTPMSLIPARLSLASAQPNPVRESGSLAFVLPRREPAAVTTHDLSGRVVKTEQVPELPAGRHSWTWQSRAKDGSRLAPGVYFLSLRAGGEVVTDRIVVLQ